MKVFEVYEVQWPSRHITSPSHGVFAKFEVAESYVKETYTPIYDRHMVIIEVEVREEWPSVKMSDLPILTYYKQLDGQVVRE